jgi:hypothetical protein
MGAAFCSVTMVQIPKLIGQREPDGQGAALASSFGYKSSDPASICAQGSCADLGRGALLGLSAVGKLDYRQARASGRAAAGES